MCGRFTLTVGLEEVVRRFQIEQKDPVEDHPRYNIAPTQEIPVVVSRMGQRQLVPMRWGLIPAWAKDASFASRMINARRETVAQKPAFRHSFKRKRCLVPADGYYEWKVEQGTKKPYRIVKEDGELMAFAGLWDRWTSPQGIPMHTFTIITVTASKNLRDLHHRMPVILEREAESVWLNPEVTDPTELGQLFHSSLSEQLEAYPVSTVVNSARNDVPECVVPIA